MPPPRIRFFFDYVDPLSWLMERRLTDVMGLGSTSPSSGSGRLDSPALPRIRRVPFELAPPDTQPIRASDPEWEARSASARVAADLHGLAYRPAEYVPRSRKAIELAEYAVERGAFDRVHRALFDAHLTRGLDIGRVDVLVDLAVQAGLDRSEVKAVLDVDRYAADVDAARARALELGVTTTPSVWVGDRGFTGLLDFDELSAALGRQA